MEKKLQKNASYILQFIDSTRFMARLSIIFHKKFIELNANADMMIKKYETCRIKYKYCDCIL